ncbi:hypothetical protein CONPUDRAFT_150730 [Coniophora puteana RWD-64-598 SS2]|uniref:DUF6533 domain-containing protein n=1 Tax=Coniophora puteana (strain RWD-64-598) TaxID=741705 RepID=A0A5M3MWY9_CONPW|nr:uncharacterized protein CONPUDRAFT_150730 [Coniophora puteana RWD-64-598 SS2]EIW83659.1 hypothetical protein CONPUDRAFT_150730 [Coniophora puteana RWD-64-598 SS2]
MFTNSLVNSTTLVEATSGSTSHTKAVSLAMFTVVIYDYVLNLDLEIDLVWEAGFISVLYVMLRYFGFLWAGLELILNLELPLARETYAATSFASIISLLATGPSLVSTIERPNAGTCEYTLPPNRRWSWPVAAGTVSVFELVLCGFALRYALKHYKASRWRSPTCTAGTLMRVIIRDNILYFFVAFADLLIAAVISAPSLRPRGAFSDILLALEFGFNTMLGPWLVLSVRKQKAETTGGVKYFDGDAWLTFISTIE